MLSGTEPDSHLTVKFDKQCASLPCLINEEVKDCAIWWPTSSYNQYIYTDNMKEELPFSFSSIKVFCCLTYNLYQDSSVYTLTSTGTVCRLLHSIHTCSGAHLAILSWAVKWLGYEADHSLPCGVEVTMPRCYTSTPHIFVAWYLNEHRENYLLLHLTQSLLPPAEVFISLVFKSLNEDLITLYSNSIQKKELAEDTRWQSFRWKTLPEGHKVDWRPHRKKHADVLWQHDDMMTAHEQYIFG
jgi:hypothetical protein